MDFASIAVGVLVGIAAGGMIGFWLKQTVFGAQAEAEREKLESERKRAQDVVAQAEREAENRRREAEIQAKDFIFRAKSEFEEQTREERKEIQALEKRLLQREEHLDRKMDQADARLSELDRRDAASKHREQDLATRGEQLEQLYRDAAAKLESIAEMTTEEAKRQIVERALDEAKHESIKLIRKIEDEARETAEMKAKWIIGQAIQRYAGEYVAERTVTVFPLPSDELKGRIIGREGRNIRAIEAATGVDLIVDDTPETVIISCHNPIRREVARRTLEALIADGRIHPTRIEDTVAKVGAEVEASVKEAGEQALYEVGVRGVHPEIVRTLGMLKYRTSYTQNVLQHSIEAAFLCGAMAAELGLDPKKARRAALLHDIGKAVTHEVEGSHALIGGEMAQKYHEQSDIVHAIAAHHEDIPQEGILPVLVQAADAISGARPGARREMLASYIQRLEDLERIAGSFDGIDKSYAIQAGRELRVIVQSQRVNDEGALVLARDIAKKIEDEMTFPGQIKVTVVRETRSVHYAR